MVRRILIPTLESKWLLGAPIESNPLVNSYHRSDGYLELLEGQTFWFGSLEEPEYAEGPNVDVVWIDEAQYIRRFADSQDVALRRLRGSGKTSHDITQSIVTTTPPPLLPKCRLYDFYENPATRNMEAKVYRWSMLDNPHLPEKYKQEIIATHHGSLARRFIDGLFAPAGIGSFAYDSATHEYTQNWNSIHDRIRNVVYGVDFGWTNPSAIIAIGFDNDNRAYILDEFYQNRTQTETLITELKEMTATYGQGRIICDRSEPQTIDMLRKAGLNAVADESKREDGIHELGGRFTVQKDGKPRLFVNSQCVKWISEVMVYDAEVKENDHAIDATRYAIMSVVGKLEVTPAWVFG
jgi:phage terminase large subunit